MAKKEGNHHIEEQIINLTINGPIGDKEVRELQENFVFYYKEYIGNELQRIFDELVPPDIHIQIDNLEIDLGKLNFRSTKELESTLRQKIRATIAPQVKRKIDELRLQAERASKRGGGRKKGFSTMNILEHLLTKGYYPNWASRDNGSMDELLQQLLEQKPQVLLRNLVRLSKNERVLERLYQQFSQARLVQLFELIYGKESEKVRKRLLQIQKRLRTTSEKALISAAIEYRLKNSNASQGWAPYDETALSQAVLETVQRRRGNRTVASKVRPGYEDNYSDVQIIGYFLEHGAIPIWADVDSKRSLQGLMDDLLETQLVPLQRILERRLEQPTVLKRLIYQFSDDQLLRLLTPASEETTDFVAQTIEELNFLTRSRQNIERPIAATAIREVVFTEALQLFFIEKKTRLVKKSFLRTVFEQLAPRTGTPYTTLVKEAYKSVRRKKDSGALKTVLEQLDDQLRQTLQAEREELRVARRDYRAVERELAPLLRKQEQGTLTAAEATELQQLQRRVQQLEQKMAALDDADQPLEIEQVVQQRQALQQQLRTAQASEQTKLEQRLKTTNKEFERLQQVLQREVKNLLRDKEKLNTRQGSIAEQRIKRVNNRLAKYQRAIGSVIQQLRLDQADLTTYLNSINRALRGDVSNEEKQRLRQERSRLQKELVQINETIAALEAEGEALSEALAETIQVVEEGAAEETGITGTTKLDLLLFMLQYGAVPWWAEDLPRQSIQELMLEFAQEEPQALLRAFRQIGKYPVVWERLLNQVPGAALRQIVIQLFPSDSQVILGQVELLRTIHFSQAFEKLNAVDANTFVWGTIIEQLLTNRQAFNAQDFVRETVLQTARTHGISPNRLLELSNNIATNRQAELGAFLTWNNNLLQDPATGVTEREIADVLRVAQEKEEGTYLTNDQKLELLVEFFSTGRITDRAKAFQLNNQGDFERLLLEQMQTNRPKTAQVMGSLLRLSNARTFVIERLSDYLYWEIVNLVRPQAVLPAQRHFNDLRLLREDDQLRLEKDVLLNYFITNQQGFDMGVFLRQLVGTIHQRSGRSPLAIITDWKRTLKARGMALQSSLLLSVVLLEVNAIKAEQKDVEDMELMATLNERVQASAQEYSTLSTAMAELIAQETAENQAASDNRTYTFSELEQALQTQQRELDALETQYRDQPPATALERLELERKIAQYKGAIANLQLKRSPILRKLEHDIAERQRNLERLRVRAERRSDAALEPVAEDVTVEPSLLERQAEALEYLEGQNPYILELLPPLLEDLQDADQSQALFHRDVQQAATGLRDERLRQAVVDILDQYIPDITPIAELQRMNDLDDRQAALLNNFNQRSPFELWREWEALEQYFEDEPAASTPARQRLQRLIQQAIRRREQQNLRYYVTNLRSAQRNLEARLDQASTPEALQAIQEELTQLWEQQQYQANELVQVARDAQALAEYERLRRNVDRIFTNIQNRRIRKSNQLLQEAEDDVTEGMVSQENALKALEEERRLQIQRLEDAERPNAQPQEPKPRRPRSKLPAIPQPVDEPLQIYNAGMVLLYPFISRLFGMLQYTKGREFVDEAAQHKAIHILQYLVTGRTEAPEHELVLNKVLCGFPITEPVPFGIEFTEHELKTAESLLQGVIQNWPKMKNMSPNSLRGSFLAREGTIKEEEAKWQLEVKKQAYDLLLKSIPWGYSFIRFPWTEKFVTVEWKLM